MIKQSLHVKVDGIMQKYTAVTTVCIFEDMHWKDLQFDEPVLYFQQRRKTKHGQSCKERVIPLSKITYMSY